MRLIPPKWKLSSAMEKKGGSDSDSDSSTNNNNNNKKRGESRQYARM